MQGAFAVVAGLVAGLLHVWSGPDHLAAIAPLSAEWTQTASRRRRSWVIGLRWGVGHSSGVMLIGLLSLIFREALPLNSLSSISERLVGVVLIVIGIWGLCRAFAHRVHSHPHKHGNGSHTHFHLHDTGTAHEPGEPAAHTHTHAAFAVGTLHGLAGSSHLFGVLPALAFPTMFGTIDYLFAYAAGTVLGMAMFSSAVAALRQWQFLSGAAGYRRIMCACSTAAVAVGIYWIW
jgi:hypothetical protein